MFWQSSRRTEEAVYDDGKTAHQRCNQAGQVLEMFEVSMQRDSQTHESGWRLAAGRGATALQRRAVSPWRSESKHSCYLAISAYAQAGRCLSARQCGAHEGCIRAESYRIRGVLTSAAYECTRIAESIASA